ncbi:hypothetical protein KPATCC21470_0710 [Kitasatospora purpeofusca]
MEGARRGERHDDDRRTRAPAPAPGRRRRRAVASPPFPLRAEQENTMRSERRTCGAGVR